MGNMSLASIIHVIAVAILPLLFAITLHEAAHGWAASKLGDKTALMLGRVSLNPSKHIDPLGTVFLPIVMLVLSKFSFAFGWAKPVPVSWQNLSKPRRDMALVALAGPAANLFMAMLWAAIAKISMIVGAAHSQSIVQTGATFFYLAGIFGITINSILCVLNLLPIPPLDGSRVLSSLLPPRIAYQYERIEPYGLWILLALLAFGLLGQLLYPPISAMTGFIKELFGL